MKNILFVIIFSILSLTLYNCVNRERHIAIRSVNDFDSAFSSALNMDLKEARRLVDSVIASADDEKELNLGNSYKAICYLSDYQLDSVFGICEKVDSYLQSDTLCKGEYLRLAMKNISNAKGIAYSYKREIDSARKYLTEAIRYESPNRMPQAYLNLADILNQNGKFVEAAECYRRTLYINDSLGEIVRPDIIYNGLAMSYLNISELCSAEKYLNKAKEHLSEMGDFDKYILYNNFGNLYYHRKKYIEAKRKFVKAYISINSVGNGTLESTVPLFNLAEIYILLHKPDSAELFIDTISKIIRKKQIPIFTQHLKTLEMALATERGELHAAAETIKTFSDNILTPELDRIRGKYLQAYYEKAGMYKAAYALAKSNYAIDDSISRSRDRIKITDIYLRYKQDTTLINRQKEILVKDEQLRRSTTFWSALAIILIVLLIAIFVITRRQKEKMLTRHLRNIAKLRMENIRNCLSPHFTFNVINHEIANYDESDPRRHNLLSLSKMLRRCVEVSSQMSVTLEEELDFVNAYIQLECSHWGEEFKYIQTIEEGIEPGKVSIPSMFIQIPVENAIKHGLRGIEKGRILEVRVQKEMNGVRIIICNNGLKYQPQMLSTGTGTGMKVIYQTITFLNYKNTCHIEFSINVNDPSCIGNEGTKVEIFIPCCFNYQTIQTE